MVVLPRTNVERIASFNGNGPNSVSRLSLSRGQRGVRKTVGWLRGTTSQRIGYKSSPASSHGIDAPSSVVATCATRYESIFTSTLHRRVPRSAAFLEEKPRWGLVALYTPEVKML